MTVPEGDRQMGGPSTGRTVDWEDWLKSLAFLFSLL